MSERFGMADGRCYTNYDSSRIMNDKMMEEQGIPLADNYAFRRFLQEGKNAPQPNGGCLNTLPAVRDSRLPFNPSRK